MWDGFNKRKFPRIHLDCDITVKVSDGERQFSAKTENVGLGGICVIISEEIERFKQCDITLGLGDGSESPFECKGKVVWAIPSRQITNEEKSFDVGVEFMDVSEDARGRLLDFLNNHSS